MKNLENIITEIFNSIAETVAIVITQKEIKAEPVYIPVDQRLRRRNANR